MSPPADFPAIEKQLQDGAGGYLHNPLRLPGTTCSVCLTSLSELETTRGVCGACAHHRRQWGTRLADHVGFMTYAVARTQSGHVMRQYKAPTPVQEHVNVVRALLALALRKHLSCLELLAGAAVRDWTTIPSLPAKPGNRNDHPFRRLVSALAKREGLDLHPVPGITTETAARQAAEDHFTVASLVAAGSHVLIIDDTWASGGHAQSAALSLRAAGAGHVSVLAVARWLKPQYPPTRALMEQHIGTEAYVAGRCPWTGLLCSPAP